MLLAGSKVPKRDRRCRPNGHPLGWNPAVGLCCFAWVAQRQYLSTLHAFSGFKGAQTRSALQTKRPPIGPESCRGSAVSHGLPSANTSPLSRFLAGSKVPKRDRRCRPNGHPLGWNPAVGLCCFAWVAQRQYLSTLHAFSGFKGAQTRSALQTKRPPIGPESCRGSAVSHGLPSANTSPLSRFLAGSKVPKRDRRCRPNGHPLGWNPAVGLCCFAWVAQRQYLSTLHAFSGFKGAQTRSALQTKRPPIGPESCRGSAVSHGLPSANTSPLSRFLAGSKVPKRDRLCRPKGHPLGLNPGGALPFRMGCPAPIRDRRCRPNGHPLGWNPAVGLCCFAWVAQRQYLSTLHAFSGFKGAQTRSALQTKRPPIGPESCRGSAVSHGLPSANTSPLSMLL